DKIDMKQPALNLGQDFVVGPVDGQEKFRLTGRRRIASAKGRRNQTAGTAQSAHPRNTGDGESDRVTGPAGDHAGAIQRIDANGEEAKRVGVGKKPVHRQVICVWPQTKLWVIAEEIRVCRICLQGVKKIGTSRVRSLGDTDAFEEWRRALPLVILGKSKVSYHPAISELIIENKRIPLVLVRTARSAVAQGSEE